ncbi:MAG: RagB/SusD family nutrient uptake outer membrane protein [Odoribacter sp.]|nr:RagB/SusD family nutrient uptake outer membrane protein [Odoribacter sp.]
MKRNKFYLICGIICCICFACSNFLTEYSHDQAYVQSYTDLDEMIIGSGYMKCNSASYNYGYTKNLVYYPYIHFMADETEVKTTGAYSYGNADVPRILFGYYTWQKKVERDHEATVQWVENQDWNNLYFHINICNLILSQIDEQPVETEMDRQNVSRIKGEAYFLRGSYYFILANLYGKPYVTATAKTDLAVPIKLTEYKEDKVYTRATVEEVYEQTLKDLLQAESYLRDIPRKSVTRAGHTAACLMLSRVYLYMQNYAETVKWARACLAEQNDLTNLNGFVGDAFVTQSSPELIFTMGGNFIFANLGNGAGNFVVSEDLVGCYTENDLRKRHFIRANDNGIYKYVKLSFAYDVRDVSDNFALRTAEAYLNLAEAGACLGGEYVAESQNAYNVLRRNRITGYVDEHLTGEDLIKAVRQERRRELCLEGHRWFDLRRYMVNEVCREEKTLFNTFVLYAWSDADWEYVPTILRRYTLPPHDDAWTLPIPAVELESNYGMPDNPRAEREYK